MVRCHSSFLTCLFYPSSLPTGLVRYWMGPKVGASAKEIPFDTQFLLIEIEENKRYALMLPLVDNGFRASLHCGDDASIVCAFESGDAAVTTKEMRALYVAVGDNPFDLVKQGFANVAEATGTFETLDNKMIPPSVDDFGWCTWDAFYSQVTPEGILQGVEALRKEGVPPRTLILDDGWQQVNPSPPDWIVSSKRKDDSILDRIINSVTGPVLSAIISFYDKKVKTAHHGSMPNLIWRFFLPVLKGGLWNFFDNDTDFARQLSGFDPNHKFETRIESADTKTTTLKDLVSELKTRLGVKSVYCWHALQGYWRGVSEELGEAHGLNVTNQYPKPSSSLLKLEPQSAWDPVALFGVGIMSTESDLKKFYELLHTPLVEAGVDGVKVDVQSGVSAAGPQISKLYTLAMEESVAKRFPADNGAANCINCMCHSTENLYRNKITSVARASEDFFPDKPESHTVHLVNVAYNSLFIGEICLPDWDMFHSLHESAELHGAARAIGGCPVYVSDKPGEHDPQLLRKLVLPDGSVLRAKQPGRPTRDCLFVDVTSDEKSALKIWNTNSNGGVVGAFNVQGVAWDYDKHENKVLSESPPRVTAEVKPHDIESLKDHAGPFIAWKHRSSDLEFLPKGDSVMEIPLEHREYELATIVPVEIRHKLLWAPIGLANMMNSGGAIISTGRIEEGPSSSSLQRVGFESRGPGQFLAFTNVAPSRIILDDDGTILPFSHNDKNGVLLFMLPMETSEGSPHGITVEWE
jgi:raffinose synthase